MTGQPVGYRSVSCNSNVRLDGRTSPYHRVEGEMSCYDLAPGTWTWDYLNAPQWKFFGF